MGSKIRHGRCCLRLARFSLFLLPGPAIYICLCLEPGMSYISSVLLCYFIDLASFISFPSLLPSTSTSPLPIHCPCCPSKPHSHGIGLAGSEACRRPCGTDARGSSCKQTLSHCPTAYQKYFSPVAGTSKVDNFLEKTETESSVYPEVCPEVPSPPQTGVPKPPDRRAPFSKPPSSRFRGLVQSHPHFRGVIFPLHSLHLMGATQSHSLCQVANQG